MNGDTVVFASVGHLHEFDGKTSKQIGEALMGTCLYEHEFQRFPFGSVRRVCVLEKGHARNHVVRDPKDEALLEIPGK